MDSVRTEWKLRLPRSLVLWDVRGVVGTLNVIQNHAAGKYVLQWYVRQLSCDNDNDLHIYMYSDYVRRSSPTRSVRVMSFPRFTCSTNYFFLPSCFIHTALGL